MEYHIKQLADLSGVSTRTLRYYDEIGLLCPTRSRWNDYRTYTKTEVDRLHQILIYRALDVKLDEIKQILDNPCFDRVAALCRHLETLYSKREEIDALIQNVTQTIGALKGETTMTDKEKFDGLKREFIQQNETKYGAEIREKYGNTIVEHFNKKMKEMTPAKYERACLLSRQIGTGLKQAMAAGGPDTPDAQAVCQLHKEWLCLYWPEGTYTPEAHRGVGEMYATDERFQAYYDKIQPGAAVFLRDALRYYCYDTEK